MFGIGKDIGKNAGSTAAEIAGQEAEEALQLLHANVISLLQLIEAFLRRNKIIIQWKFPFRVEIEAVLKSKDT